jgi:hypothetical protein
MFHRRRDKARGREYACVHCISPRSVGGYIERAAVAPFLTELVARVGATRAADMTDLSRSGLHRLRTGDVERVQRDSARKIFAALTVARQGTMLGPEQETEYSRWRRAA